MSEYSIGKDIGELFSRVKALEEKSSSCDCNTPVPGGEMIARCLEGDEISDCAKQKIQWCTYITQTSCPELGINFGDTLCVMPCPPCNDIIFVRIVDKHGATICVLRVRFAAAGSCTDCPPGGVKLRRV